MCPRLFGHLYPLLIYIAHSIIQRMRMPYSFQRQMLFTFNVPFFATQNKQHILTSQCFLLYIRFHTLSHSFCFRVAEQEKVASENENRKSECISLHSIFFVLIGVTPLHTLSARRQTDKIICYSPETHAPIYSETPSARRGRRGSLLVSREGRTCSTFPAPFSSCRKRFQRFTNSVLKLELEQ